MTKFNIITAFGLISTGAIGCSLLLSDSDAQQCAVDADCASIAQNLVCGPAKTCIAQPAGPRVVTQEDAGEASCLTHEECIQANGGRPAICPTPGASRCVNIASDVCDQVEGNYKDPNAIFWGFLHDKTAPLNNVASLSVGAYNQVMLAFQEFSSNLVGAGLPGGPAGARRPLVMVTCDGKGSDSRRQSAAEHLVGTLNAPLLLTVVDDTAKLVQQRIGTLADPPLHLSLTSGDFLRQALAGTGNLEVLFQVFSPQQKTAVGHGLKTPDLEASLRGAGLVEPTRVAMVVSGNPLYQRAAELYTQTAVFNGLKATANGSNFLRVDYPHPNVTPNIDWVSVVAPVVAQRPHIVVFEGSGEAMRSMIPTLEASWGGAWKPRYLVDSGNGPGAGDLVAGNDDLRRRVVVSAQFNNPTDVPRSDAIRAKLAAAYPVGNFNTLLVYDAFYGLNYAVVAAGPPSSGTLRGRDVTRGLQRIKTGQNYWTGPGDMAVAMAALSTGNTINLQGTWHTITWDLATGVPVFDRLAYGCVTRSASTGLPSVTYTTGQTYDPIALTLQGNLVCP